MKIERNEIERIARLARLKLTDEETDVMAKDLATILAHVRELNAVDTAEVSPIVGASEHPAPMRSDTPGADTLRLTLAQIAPEFQEGFFTVPRLAALDTDALTAGGEA